MSQRLILRFVPGDGGGAEAEVDVHAAHVGVGFGGGGAGEDLGVEGLHVEEVLHAERRDGRRALPGVAGEEEEVLRVDAVFRVTDEVHEAVYAIAVLVETVDGEEPDAGAGAEGVAREGEVTTFEEEDHGAGGVTLDLDATQGVATKVDAVATGDEALALRREESVVGEVDSREKETYVLVASESREHAGVVVVVVGDGDEALALPCYLAEDGAKVLDGGVGPGDLAGEVDQEGFVTAVDDVHVRAVVDVRSTVRLDRCAARVGGIVVLDVPDVRGDLVDRVGAVLFVVDEFLGLGIAGEHLEVVPHQLRARSEVPVAVAVHNHDTHQRSAVLALVADLVVHVVDRRDTATVGKGHAEPRVEGPVEGRRVWEVVEELVGAPGEIDGVPFDELRGRGTPFGKLRRRERDDFVGGAGDGEIRHIAAVALHEGFVEEGFLAGAEAEGRHDAAGLRAHGSEDVSLLDAERSRRERTGRQAFGVHSRAVELRILLQEGVHYGFDTVVAHRSPAVALPLELSDHEAFLCCNREEAGGLSLGTRVVVVAVQKYHERDCARCCGLNGLRDILVPEVLSGAGEVFRADVAGDAETVELHVLEKFVVSVLAVALSSVPGVAVITVSAVTAEEFVPGVGDDCLKVLFRVLIDNQNRKKVFGIYVFELFTFLRLELHTIPLDIAGGHF